jgi:hypothetical protein
MSNIEQQRRFAMSHTGPITAEPKATIGDREFGNAPAKNAGKCGVLDPAILDRY